MLKCSRHGYVTEDIRIALVLNLKKLTWQELSDPGSQR